MTARMTLACAFFALAPSYATVTPAQDAAPPAASEVRVSVGSQPPRPMREGEALPSGSTITTGASPRVVLRFPDGQRVVLGARTQFRIVDYHYVAEAPQADRALFHLAAGTARFITGMLGERSRDLIAISTPQVTLGVRGTDFVVAAIGGTYLHVLQGAVDAHTATGPLLFEPGTYGAMAASEPLAAVIPADVLPREVAAVFAQLVAVRP